jgi:hypothetical protein
MQDSVDINCVLFNGHVHDLNLLHDVGQITPAKSNSDHVIWMQKYTRYRLKVVTENLLAPKAA